MQLPPSLGEVLSRFLRFAPDRVVINSQGEAVPPIYALEVHNVVPTVVFVRNDGWTLGAPEEFKQVAHDMWSGLWVAKLTWSGLTWICQPIENGEVQPQEQEKKMEIQVDSSRFRGN